MGRGSTALNNREYDDWLANQQRERELMARKAARKEALKKDLTGYMFSIDDQPVKVGGVDDVRRELDKRGLALKDEYKGNYKRRMEHGEKLRIQRGSR